MKEDERRRPDGNPHPPHAATVAQPKVPHAATMAQPKVPHAATVAQPKVSHAATPDGVAQPFWLREGKTVKWVKNEALNDDTFRDTGQKQWWSSWLPGFVNEELPVYERKSQQKQKQKPNTRPKITRVEEPPPLTSEQWLDYVQTTLRDWVDERGGLAKTGKEPQDYEFKQIWNSRPQFFNGEWDGWQDLKRFYASASGVEPIRRVAFVPRSSKTTTKVHTPKDPQKVVDQYVTGILDEIELNIGRFPVYSKKDNPGRAGCVMYGPAITVPKKYAEAVYKEFLTWEGTAFRGGYLHIVKKSAHRQYNITLHGVYRAPNPKTMVNMHIDAS